MNETNSICTRPAGAQQISRVFSIDQLERALSKGIAQHMEPFHYDEICRIDGLSKVRAVRTEDGSIDILGTFLKVKARKAHVVGGGIL